MCYCWLSCVIWWYYCASSTLNFVRLKCTAFQNMIWRYCGSSTSNCNNIMKPHRLTGIGCHLEMMKTESLIVVTALWLCLIDVILICSVFFVWVCLLLKDYCIALYNHVISKNKPVKFFTWIKHWIMWQVNEGTSMPFMCDGWNAFHYNA